MRRRRTYIIPFASTGLLVAAADLGSKHLAESLLTRRAVPYVRLGDLMRLIVVHNDGLAFGFSLGSYTWTLSVAVSVAAIALIVAVCGELAAIDKAAPRALGFIGGAALGNLASLVFSPAGVVDFLAIGQTGGRELVLNMADVAAYVGLVMIARTAWLAVRALRTEQQPRRATTHRAARGLDLEMPLPLSVEPGRSAPPPYMRSDADADVWPRASSARPQPRAD
jgi:lipoprotein signal peptidase